MNGNLSNRRIEAGRITRPPVAIYSLRYSTAKPTVPGWYWCKNGGDAPGEIAEFVCRIDLHTGRHRREELVVSWLTSRSSADVMFLSDCPHGVVWAGPIQRPFVPEGDGYACT